MTAKGTHFKEKGAVLQSRDILIYTEAGRPMRSLLWEKSPIMY